jgi:hypothetical protein
MKKANAASAGKPLVRSRADLSFAAQCFLFVDFTGVAEWCEPWIERRITWHAWRLLLSGHVQIHPSLRERVETRARTLCEIRAIITPGLWQRAIRNYERTPLWQ